MAPTKSTTLRVPTGLRDQIARMAEERGTTMLEVVGEAIDRLNRERWWESVRSALDNMSDEELDDYTAEAERLEGTAADGLHGG